MVQGKNVPTTLIYSPEQIQLVKDILQSIQDSQMTEQQNANTRVSVLVDTIKIWRILKGGKEE